jgi:hypothetical protein
VKVSGCLTIQNRPPEVSKAVADSFRLPGNYLDELIVVLDTATKEARDGAHEAYDTLDFPVRFITIPGDPKWKCPAQAWNFAYTAATGDLLYCISSEVVQEDDNVEKAKEIAKSMDLVVFGACRNSIPEQLVVGGEPGVLASAALPRPLGFISCLPRKAMTAIGGNDLGFMDGLWFEDDDLYYRLWRHGLDFVFDDSISGIHLHHERPALATQEGQKGIARNQAYMLYKHNSLKPLSTVLVKEERQPGRTVWRHA